MSSTRFPSPYGEGIVNDALEQEHRESVNKNADQALSLATTHSAVTKEPRVHGSGGYTKLTSTDPPEPLAEALDMTDVPASETEVPLNGHAEEGHSGLVNDQVEPLESPMPSVIQRPKELDSTEAPETHDMYTGDLTKSPAALVDNQEKETESPLPSVTQRATASAVDSGKVPASDASSEPASNRPNPGGRSAEIADLISRMKESQNPSPEMLPSTLEQDSLSATPPLAPQSVEIELSAAASKVFLDNLLVWLTGDSGVEVENLAACLASSGDDFAACAVNSWTNQIASSDPNAPDSTAFRAASPQQRPVWTPIVPDTHNQLPVVYFSCPMVSDALRVHESMTLLFVLSPARIETGDSYTGQKFFGNSPYGQFALHGGKPSFFANDGLVESAQDLPMGQFSLVAYRLHQGFVEIKVNGRSWSGESPVEGGTDERRVRVTVNDVVSLGNSKGACDTNAFQGRIAEVLVYDAVLDDAKVEAVEKYLHGKWWGDKPFPQTAAPPTTATAMEPVPDVLHEEIVSDTPPVDPETKATPVAGDPQTPEETKRTSTPEKPLPDIGEDATQESATEAEEDVTPAPKFDPRVNIFEWTPPSGEDLAKAKQWTSTVKEKINYIRNFQLGGEVLRALIRDHKDELLALREELFG